MSEATAVIQLIPLIILQSAFDAREYDKATLFSCVVILMVLSIIAAALRRLEDFITMNASCWLNGVIHIINLILIRSLFMSALSRCTCRRA